MPARDPATASAPGPDASRRRVLALAARLSAVLAAAYAADPRIVLAAPDDDDARATLAATVRVLFPHDQLAADVYAGAAAAILEVARTAPDTQRSLAEGLAALGPDPSARALHDVEGTPFFQLIHAKAFETIYRDPRTWQLLGYGGSSFEFGGYVNRGFDDIDWLP
ncbi:MAG: hypothetical protein IT495_07635 [Gammaproteobacteria bacterium]|nr:hypothetical protein [Gammaproteobacteria bacterium]